MKVKGGEFYNWYNNLPGYLQAAYDREFNKLQTKRIVKNKNDFIMMLSIWK